MDRPPKLLELPTVEVGNSNKNAVAGAGAPRAADGRRLAPVTSIIAPPARLVRVKAVGPVFGLVGWTLFTWANRIRNVANDASLEGMSRVWSLSIAVLFVAAALALGALATAWVAGDANVVSRRLSRAALGLAVFGAGWWAVRVVQIATHEHNLGFKLVHGVLAAITIGMGALVVRWSQRLTPAR
jgi:hypothetical protein